MALLRARAAIAGLRGENQDQDCGIGIVLRAVEEPLRQIVVNGGVEPSIVLDRVLGGRGRLRLQRGDRANTAISCEMGVLDPCKVTRTALQNAASIAGLILTTDCMVARLPAKERPGRAGRSGVLVRPFRALGRPASRDESAFEPAHHRSLPAHHAATRTSRTV